MADLDSMSMRDIVARTITDMGGNNFAQKVKILESISTTTSKLKASYASTVTTTYNILGSYIEVDNQGSETITLVVNSITIPIKSGYIFSSSFEEFTSFVINVPTTCNHQILVGGI